MLQGFIGAIGVLLLAALGCAAIDQTAYAELQLVLPVLGIVLAGVVVLRALPDDFGEDAEEG